MRVPTSSEGGSESSEDRWCAFRPVVDPARNANERLLAEGFVASDAR